MTQEDIEQGFVDAGWKLDGSFSGHLIGGEDEDLTILATGGCGGSTIPSSSSAMGMSHTGCRIYRGPGKLGSCSKYTAVRPKRSEATLTNGPSSACSFRA